MADLEEAVLDCPKDAAAEAGGERCGPSGGAASSMPKGG
jgi:hypothetical protein